MQRVRLIPLFNVLIGLAVAATACNLPSKAPSQTATVAALETAQAELTQAAATRTPIPTYPVVTTVPPPTLAPSSTPVRPTATSSCDIADFLTDVTIPDGTTIPAGQAFTKTWRFRNVGSCSWTTSYSIVFSSGNQMGGPNTQALAGNVNPGESVDISVNLTAPTTPGDYTGNWKLRNAAGVLFTNFYVDITVQASVTNTPPTAQLTLNAVPGESGTVYEAAASLAVANTIRAGDTAANFIARGYMSFDISSLAGKTIRSATLDLSTCTQTQNPFTSSLAGIWISDLQYPLPLDQSDYDLTGTAIQSQPLNALPTSPIDVKSFLQSRINEGRARFQLRLHPAGPSDGDGQADDITCNPGSLTLKIAYQP